jgi:tRNA-dihydrouridine synthase
VLDDNFIRIVKINEIDLSKVPIIQKAPTMQCQNTHTFDKVKEVIQILKTLDNGDGVDGETMEYILEQVGMTDQMLRQLIMNNPESETKDLLEEKISLNERRIFNLN